VSNKRAVLHRSDRWLEEFRVVNAQIAELVIERAAHLGKINRQLETKVAGQEQGEQALRQRIMVLEARIEDLEAFARNVAHTLQTPVGHMTLLAELLKEECLGEPPNEEIDHCLNLILKNGLKMKTLIDGLFLLTGVCKKNVEMTPLDMASIVAEAQEQLTFLIKGCQAEISAPVTWPKALGYRPWVEEVWVNYLSNAIKYGGRPPRLELGATVLEAGEVRFWVRDNGPGLTPEEQAQLFTPFTRFNPHRADGYGVGLSIVRSIVERLGGQVRVESQVGGGSTFTFTLPVSWNQSLVRGSGFLVE
jgi:two-component system sensor histidine kinase/response regulator